MNELIIFWIDICHFWWKVPFFVYFGQIIIIVIITPPLRTLRVFATKQWKQFLNCLKAVLCDGVTFIFDSIFIFIRICIVL